MKTHLGFYSCHFLNYNRRVALLVVLLLALLTTVSSAQQASLEKAITLYQTSKYQNAQSQFELLAAQAETSALRYNLALTELKLEHPAAARWQIERARLLDPFNNRYQQTQTQLLQQLELPPRKLSLLHKLAQILTATAWLWLATLVFWVLLAVFILPKLLGHHPSLGIKIARVSCVLILLISFLALRSQQLSLHAGIVSNEKPVELRTAPASAAPKDGVAKAGEWAQIIERHHQFYKIETASEQFGWISKQDFKPIDLSGR